jgi:TRAP transporter TAXI family solute receptor
LTARTPPPHNQSSAAAPGRSHIQQEEFMIRPFRISGVCAAVLVAAAFATPSAAEQVTFMTGPQGGVWVPLGGALKGMWEKAIPGLEITASPGAGIANVRGVDEDKAQIGFGNTITTVDGIVGRPPFPKKLTKVCNIASLYPQYFQVVVRTDAKIDTIADLKGKSLVTQPKGNTAELVTQELLAANGVSYSQLKVSFQSYTDAVDMVKDGHAQAFTLGTTIPSSAVMDLANARDVKLLPITDEQVAAMRKTNRGYIKATIPANTYPKQDKPVDVIAYATHVVVSCTLPEQTVYTMVKTMATNVNDLAAVNKAISGLTPKAMAEDVGVPFHPGAVKFYKEVKAM